MALLGKIMYKIFKNYAKAKNFLSSSVSLGMSLHPKNIESEAWYQRASIMLENIRNELLKQEALDAFQKNEVHLNKFKK